VSKQHLSRGKTAEWLCHGQQRGKYCQVTVPERSQWSVQVCMQTDVDY